MIRVASFNVRNLSLATKDEESMRSRDFDKIASLVRDYDIVVLQEVLSPHIVEDISFASQRASLTRKLGLSWRGKWVDPKSSSKMYPFLGNDKRGEGYAFLWNTKRIELLKDNSGNEITPTRYSQYRTGDDFLNMKLLRDPGYGRFKLKNRPVEIRVITAHIIFGKPSKDNLSIELDAGAIAMRKNEFKLLSGKIYKNINDYRKDDHINSVYTIIIGDYNLNLEGSGLTNATIPELCYFYSQNNSSVPATRIMKTVQREPTTISTDCDGYANNYDHCTFDINLEHNNVIGRCFRVPAINEKDSVERIKEYRDTVSDHVPIVVEINC